MTKIRLILFALLLAACEKPNPTPELSDAIYSDLTSQADTVAKEAESEKKKLEGLKKEMSEAKPYSGDLKSAQKRYFESEKKLQHLYQKKYFYTLRARTRKDAVRSAYAKSYAEKKAWDSADEAKSYSEHQRIANIPLGWDSKRRIASYEKETGFGGINKGTSAEAAPPKAAEPKKH